jgi:hypothetical protein
LANELSTSRAFFRSIILIDANDDVAKRSRLKVIVEQKKVNKRLCFRRREQKVDCYVHTYFFGLSTTERTHAMMII